MLARPLAVVALTLMAVPAAFAQCNGATCKVTISVQGTTCSDATIRVQPDEVAMGRGANKTVVWRFDGGDFRFCASDGVQFKTADTDFQFFGAGATDDEEGGDQTSTPDPCRKHFRWRNKNEPHTAGKRYAYLIRFTGPGGQACVKDPFIRNG
jgi:hypothetical protein